MKRVKCQTSKQVNLAIEVTKMITPSKANPLLKHYPPHRDLLEAMKHLLELTLDTTMT
jgi:hypothetical protein